MPSYEGTHLSRSKEIDQLIPDALIEHLLRYNIDKTSILKGKRSNGLVLGRAKTNLAAMVPPRSQPVYWIGVYSNRE
ncbi:hypothetical protein CSPAE12_02434 [Colletotrichum incanum]|nr:hypothetical protein CSPAE12_02434 [Colletotrichum incanum]